MIDLEKLRYNINKNGVIKSSSGKSYIYSGANDKLTNKPVWQQIGKDNKPIEMYITTKLDGTPIKTTKPDILKIKDTPEYWGAYYSISNKFLKNPTAAPEFINSYLPGIPDLTWAGVAGWIASDPRAQIQDSIQELDNIIKNINEHLNKEKEKDVR